MEKSITVTVSTTDHSALIRAAEMFQNMAADLKIKTSIESNVVKSHEAVAILPAIPPAATFPPDIPPTTPPAAPAAVAVPNAVELDSNGIPWDGRIHSSKKSKLAKDQTWKKKRGANPEFVAQVEAELRAAMAAPAAVVTPVIPLTPAAAPVIAIPPPPAQVAITFPEFMARITEALTTGTLTDEMILVAVGKQGLTSIAMLAARPDLIPAVILELFGA